MIESVGSRMMSIGMRLVGCTLVPGLYALICMHLYAFFTVITPLLKNRLGTEIGLLWVVVGLTLAYNIVFNHFMATILKPGGPQDTKDTEKMRSEQKKRSHRKAVDDLSLAKDSTDERFEGLSSSVKKLLRYRSKTTTQLEEFWPKRCDKCNIVKPARAHHCKIC